MYKNKQNLIREALRNLILMNQAMLEMLRQLERHLNEEKNN